MTLDDLIERLEQIRRECPAAASAYVRRPANLQPLDVKYEHGELLIGPAPSPSPFPRGFN